MRNGCLYKYHCWLGANVLSNEHCGAKTKYPQRWLVLSDLRAATREYLMIRQLWQNRRAATAVMVALVAIPLIGMAALGTEAGSWYMIKRHAQNTADAGALAGALALTTTPPGNIAVGYDYTGKNRFPNSNVPITLPDGTQQSVL